MSDPEVPAVTVLLLEESAEELYEDAPCGYISTLPDGTIMRVNRTFEEWTGHTREAMVGRVRFQDLLTGGGRIYHETHYRPLLQMQGTVREIALEIECADGRRLPVLVNSVLRRDDGGQPRVVRTTVFDATDRREYERELVRARRHAERLERGSALLAEVSRVLVLHRDVERRAGELVRLLAAELADGAALVLSGHERPVATAGRIELAVLSPLLTRALTSASRGVLRIQEEGAEAVVVPLRAGAEPVGALALELAADADAHGDRLDALLEEIADRTAVAIDNAQLFARERAVGLTLQRAMLAGAPPEDRRCQIGTHYAPAVEALEVGGDWHDAFCVAPGRIGVAIGDVVGKGLPAATAMGRLRSALRALALSGLGPSAVLEQLDRFVEDGEEALGATVAIAEADLSAGTLRLACAGHPPPVLLPAEGHPELLWEGRSPPLGAWPEPARRPEAELPLPAGARLLLYTDGVVERRDRPIDVGIERLMEAFARRRDAPVADIGAALAAELLPERHGADDVCTLVLAYTP